MTVKRDTNFGTYFFVGFIGMLIGSVVGSVLIRNVFRPGLMTRIINLGGFSYKLLIQIGGHMNKAGQIVGGYVFTLNLIAILGILLAIYIYRRI